MFFSLKLKLTLSFVLVLLLLLSISMMGILANIRNTTRINEVENEILADTITLLEIQKDVVQVQQWLTDISATRGKDGLDDGIVTAVTYYNDARDKLKNLMEDHEMEQVQAETVQSIGETLQDLDDFFVMGEQMATTYIESGTAQGNRMMVRFDPFAEKITSELEQLVAHHKKELSLRFSDMQEQSAFSIRLSIIISGVALAVVLLLSILLSRSIMKSINALISYTSATAQGDLTGSADVRSKDEFSHLAGAFSEFVYKLKGIVTGIKETAAENTRMKQELSAGTEETAASLVQISANLKSIQDQIEMLNTGIRNASVSSEEIARTVSNMNTRIESQAAMVEESTASITEMIASIENVSGITAKKKDATDTLVRTAEQGGSKLAVTIRNVGEIANFVSDIREITDIISRIAGQMDLLSMNAAIEAAHAGDVGKGFAVVADEMRKLAETSSTNSKQISGILKEMISRIEAASLSAHDTGEAFDAINGEVVEVAEAFSEIAAAMMELQTGGKQILDAVTRLQEVTVQGREGFSEINTGVEGIASSMNEFNQISQQVSGAMNEISKGAQEISLAMNEVMDINHNLEETMNTLTSKISFFEV